MDSIQEVDTNGVNSNATGPESVPTFNRVHYGLNIDTENTSPPPVIRRLSRSDTAVHREPFSPLRRRRSTRAATFRPIDDADDFDFDATYTERPGWEPGSEPGFDPNLPDGGHASMPQLSADCDITVVDFSKDNMVKRHFDNESFITFLTMPKEKWAKCRWINVNGLSWDVIQAIGAHKGLHKLALEDIMNIRNRTKADWYPNHAFIIMTLQKLVHLVDDDDSSSDSSSIRSRKSTKVKDFFRGFGSSKDDKLKTPSPPMDPEKRITKKCLTELSESLELQETSMIRTLQRYHASGNETRTDYMEANSILAPLGLAVSAEQVSIFLTADNTVISFFEVSAGDVERPIVTRLSNPGTILRESCDASLLVQAIIDAIIDLAIPLTAVYNDVLGDLELDVLTSPSIKQCKSLYICISEINKMLRFLNPIDNLVNVLRDHKTDLPHEAAIKELENPASGVIVTPMTHTYLGDVLDHCIIITEALQQCKQSSDNLINLIFNTISANQNESMKQLTTVTIIFLPLTFITGFFGQNFPADGFPEINNGIWYFWACAVPTAFATILILMREMIYSWFVRVVQRNRVRSNRKKVKAKRRTRA
ncbi:cora-like magnesium transporter [Trichoderma evansii]